MKRTQLIGVLLASFAGGTQAQEAKPAAASEQAYTQVYYNVGSNMVTWGYYAINLAAAQNAGITGRGVKVAVFDTGLAITNPKFNSNNTTTGWNLYGAGGAGSVGVTTDNSTHGTFVSGIIAASNTVVPGMYNSYGIAPNAKIMSIQILDKNGAVSGTDAQMAKAINYATTNGARIFNNSWNSSNTLADLSAYYGATKYVGLITKSWYSQEIAAWQLAATKNVLNVWAAGNYSKKDPGYYAALPSIVSGLASTWIVVVGTDQTGALASWSNACGISAAYCMAAPGDKILSTYTSPTSGNTVGTGSGTSFAAPMVAGAAALMMEKWPTLTAAKIQELLFTTANKAGIYSNIALYGQGMLDLTKAFAPVGTLAVASASGSITPITGTYVATSGAFGSTVSNAMGKIDIIALDSYKRDYQLNLGAGVFASMAINTWGDQLAVFGADEKTTKDGVVISGSANGLRSSFAMTNTTEGIGAAFGSNISPSLAYGPFANGSIRGSDLVLLNSVGNPYMNMAPNGTSVATSYTSGSSTTRIGAFTNTVPKDDVLQMQRADLPQIAGGTIENTQRWDSGYVSTSLGMVSESNSVLGTRSGGALSMGRGANTVFAGLTAGFDLNRNWSVFGGATTGYSMIEASSNSMITGIKGLSSANAFAGVTKTQILGDADRLGIVVGVPMRVNTGSANLNVPTSVDGDGNVNFDRRKIGLASNSTEFSVQSFYSTELNADQSLGFGVGAKFDTQSSQGGNTEVVGMARYKLRF